MSPKLKHMFAICYAIFIFMFSIIFYGYYTESDLYTYNNFYNSLSSFSFASGYENYRYAIGSLEPVYYVVVYFAAFFFEKIYFLSVINGIVAYVFYLLLSKIKVNGFILVTLLFNYYLLVIYLPAERLKFAFLFFGISFLVPKKIKPLFWGVSVLSHVQAIFLVYLVNVKFFLNFFDDFTKLRLSLSKLFVVVVVFLFMLLILNYLSEHIEGKYDAYAADGHDPLDIVKIFIFLILALFYAKEKRAEVLLSFIPIILGAFLVGADRITIFAYIVFVFYSLKVNRGLNLGVLLTSFYFLYKGYDFLWRAIVYGYSF